MQVRQVRILNLHVLWWYRHGRYIWKQKCGKFLPHFCLLRWNILFETFEAFGNILFNSAKDGFLVRCFGCLNKLFYCNLLVKLNVSVCNIRYDLRCHFWNLLTLQSLKTVGHKPFPYEFLRKLFLTFTFCETFLVTVGIEVAR